MKCLLLFFIGFIFNSTCGYSQNVQWASKVLKCSSQYSKAEYSANQTLGKPNSLPAGGNSPLAWAVEEDGGLESKDEATLTLGYATPMAIQQVAIAENYCPGAVERVLLIDTEGDEHEVYKGTLQSIGEKGRILNIFFPMTSYLVEAVELTLQPGKVEGWNEIDAVGISDSKDSVKASMQRTSIIKFESKPENLGSQINSEYSEKISAISHDGKTLFICRTGHPGNVGHTVAGQEFEQDAWYSNLLPDGTWAPLVNMGFPINNTGNNFVNSISPDGNTLLLGNWYKSDGSYKSGGVSMTHRTADGWSIPENQLFERYDNRGRFVNFELSADGKVMILSIQADKTFGMNDLYVSFLKKNGDWSRPQNMGATINSVGNDICPFLASDGVTLYFSTNGKSGYGDNDIFLTRRLDDSWTNWSEPENLGDIINSPGFEGYFKIPASGEYAYFSSRIHSYGSEDIFRIALPKAVKPQPVVLVSGKVYNSKTKQPIEAVIKYEVLSDSTTASIARTNPSTGEYKIVLPHGKDFGFQAEANNFYAISANINTSNLLEYQEITRDLYLTPIEVGQTFRLNNIFFKLREADLMAESYLELNRVVKFLNENPDIEIQLSGHTDNVGNEASNQTLSENRSKSVANYIVSQGIAASRIKSIGFGKTKPVATNETDEGRQLNRRVEFTIIKK